MQMHNLRARLISTLPNGESSTLDTSFSVYEQPCKQLSLIDKHHCILYMFVCVRPTSYPWLMVLRGILCNLLGHKFLICLYFHQVGDRWLGQNCREERSITTGACGYATLSIVLLVIGTTVQATNWLTIVKFMLYDLLSCLSHLYSLLDTSLLEYSCDREQTVISRTEMKVYWAPSLGWVGTNPLPTPRCSYHLNPYHLPPDTHCIS